MYLVISSVADASEGTSFKNTLTSSSRRDSAIAFKFVFVLFFSDQTTLVCVYVNTARCSLHLKGRCGKNSRPYDISQLRVDSWF